MTDKLDQFQKVETAPSTKIAYWFDLMASGFIVEHISYVHSLMSKIKIYVQQKILIPNRRSYRLKTLLEYLYNIIKLEF